MTQDSSNLKDELRGLFDDRKMAYRIEQKHMDGQVSPWNIIRATKLTIEDSKPELSHYGRSQLGGSKRD